nr:RHS repeat-associated core domain-containing protein [Pseudomonas sp. EggHat1]
MWQARYQVWGNTLAETQESFFVEEQNLRFQGRYLDRETGLHYNTFRFYDPDIGRFISPDPIGVPPINERGADRVAATRAGSGLHASFSCLPLWQKAYTPKRNEPLPSYA